LGKFLLSRTYPLILEINKETLYHLCLSHCEPNFAFHV